MTKLKKKSLAASFSLIFLVSVVFERQVLGEGMNSTGTLASMGGTLLTGIGVQGMMSHTTPCLSQNKDCDKLALDVGMVAGGILAMLAGQSTSDSSSGNNSNISNFNNNNGGGGDDNNSNPFGNYNFNNNFNSNFNSNFNNNFNSNFNNNNDDDDNNNNGLCPNGICSIPPPVYDGINKYIDGLSDGSIEPPEGQSRSEAINLATANLARLEGALGQLQENLNLDKDTYFDPNTSQKSSLDEDLGDFQSGRASPSKNGSNSTGSLRFNGLEVEDTESGQKLSLFERATRRYNGTRDYNRAFILARLEVFRKRALQLASNSKKNKSTLRSPASTKR